MGEQKQSKGGKEKLYLIVPSSDGTGPAVMEDETVQDEGIRSIWRGIVGERAEVAVDPSQVVNQINNYVSVVQDVARKDKSESGKLRLEEITLSLTLSAGGNIGIASTSAEAGLTLVFKRS